MVSSGVKQRTWCPENGKGLRNTEKLVDSWAEKGRWYWLLPWLTDCGLPVVAGHIVPFDSIGIEVVENSQADFWAWWGFSSSSVVWLRNSSSSSIGPMSWIWERYAGSSFVIPADSLLVMENLSSCPEVSLRILSYEPVECVLLCWCVKRDWLHANCFAELLCLTLFKLGAALSKFPCDDISNTIVNIVWSSVTGTTSIHKVNWGFGNAVGGEGVGIASN